MALPSSTNKRHVEYVRTYVRPHVRDAKSMKGNVWPDDLSTDFPPQIFLHLIPLLSFLPPSMDYVLEKGGSVETKPYESDLKRVVYYLA